VRSLPINSRIKKVTVEPGVKDTPAFARISFLGLPVETVKDVPKLKDYREGKGYLHLGSKRGEAFHHCLSRSREYCCCNVHVLAAVNNCPFECSYCFLQYYLNDTGLGIVADVESLVDEVREKTRKQPWRFFRVGTWDLGDSLALEPLAGTGAELVRAFSSMKNALLELKTKSACVEDLLALEHGNRTVVSWTMSPERVVRREEYKTASTRDRLKAMKAAADAGYMIAIHFDPMIYYEEWERDYRELAKCILETIPNRRIAWVSVGSLRFNPEMKQIMELNYPGSRATSAEMVLGNDGKMRYVKPLRIRMYRAIMDEILRVRKDPFFIYLCMERWDVWKRVIGWAPRSIEHLDFLITRSLYERFPGLVHVEPSLRMYESVKD